MENLLNKILYHNYLKIKKSIRSNKIEKIAKKIENNF